MKKFLFIIIIVFSSLVTSAQKVGVVLSGGGAKGLYHIGIIKALEENDIPIDYIAGTSMGSIIAGLYSIGYSYEDMVNLFMNDNVSGWVTGKVDEKYIYYYNQPSPRPSLFTTKIDLKKIIQTKQIAKKEGNTSMFAGTPVDVISMNSIIPSTILDVELMGFLAASNEMSGGDFDKLFVPFRCVAADVVKKEQYIWKEGDLAEAIRSSMSIPIIFSPIRKGDKLLYDGGVYNNFPWKEVDEEFNTDFIIGGRCVTSTPTDVSTLVGQIELMVMQTTDYNIPADKGIVIGRNVDLSMLDFSSPMQAIMHGYNDAMILMDSIKLRVKRRVSSEEVKRNRLEYKSKLPALIFSGESVESINNVIAPGRKRRAITGDTLYIDTDIEVKSGNVTRKTYSFDEFKKVFYRAVTDRSMKTEFPKAEYDSLRGAFDVKVKMTSTPTFKISAGLNISSSSINQAYLGLRYNDNRRNSGQYTVDGYLGSFYSSAELSARHNFYNRKTPVYISNSFTYNYLDYARANNQKITFNSMFKEGNYVSSDLSISSALGIKVQKNGRAELRAAVGRDLLRFSDKSFSEIAIVNNKASVKYINLGISILSDNRNYMAYPTRGISQSISASYTIANVKIDAPTEDDRTIMETIFIKNRAKWIGTSYEREQYFQLSKVFTLGYSVNVMWSNIEDLGDEYVNRAFYPRYAPTNFSKTLFLPAFQAASFIGGGIMPTFEINDKLYVKGGGFIYKNNIVNLDRINEDLKYILTAAAVFQSPLGPISFSYNHFNISPAKKNYWIFTFGYMLFNKRGVVY